MQQKNFTPQSIVGNGPGNVISRLHRLAAFALLLCILGYAQTSQAQQFIGTGITINANTSKQSSVTSYVGGDRTSAINTNQVTFFNGADLGSGDAFDVNNGSLTVTLASDTLNGRTFDSRGNIVTYPFISSTLYYRVYLDGTTAPDYGTTALTLSSASNTSFPTTYVLNGTIDLFALPRATGGGKYRVDIYFEGQYKVGSASPTRVNDPGSGAANPSSATFTVTAPAVTPSGSTTTWQSTSSSDWFLPSNWTNGVPNSRSDAIIPENTTGTNIIFPVLNDLSKNFRVRNLTLRGTTNSGRAQVTVQQAVLHVFGNIQQLSGGLVGTNIGNAGVLDSTKNSTLILLGGNQFITGRLSVPDVIIRGSGVKSVANALLPTNILSFQPSSATDGVIVQSASAQNNADGSVSYVFDTTGNSIINLSTTGSIDTNTTGQGSETTTSYVKGVLSAEGPFVNGTPWMFGNIGIELTPNHDASLVTVQRIIGDPLIGPTTPAPGATPVPIKRQYSIAGDVQATGNTSDVVFHYLNSAYELNTIKEENLTMFRTPTGAAPYTPEYGTLNQANKTVTRLGLPSLARYYLTLGDKSNPLPVSLVAFAAVRSGANALLSWTTATELTNKGFNVQVSADGVTFRTLGFVASKLVNSSQVLNYAYTDVEAGKNGTRYYRLEQVDQDGKLNYSPVRALSFDGAAATSVALVAYPNPFTNTVGLTLEGVSASNGALANVKVVDMTGRTVRDQQLALNGASLSLGDLSDLRSGLYLAKVTLPDGSTKTVRIQRQ